MTEKTEVAKPALSAKKPTDWEAVEIHFRAGIKTLRQLGDEYGVSHVAIQKKAKALGWTRDLTEKIQQKAKEIVARRTVESVRKPVVTSGVTKEPVTKKQQLTDAQTVTEYGAVLANVEMTQREDVSLSADVARSQLIELQLLGDPRFRQALEALADAMDESGPDEKGNWKVDKDAELFRYIISLPGRTKMLKEITGSQGIAIPLQRKVNRMDSEGEKAATQFEETLKAVHAALS